MNGPLVQFKEALEQLQIEITKARLLKGVATILFASLEKDEITTVFARIERLKTFVEIALQMDHL